MAEIKFVLSSNTRRAVRHQNEIIHLFKCLVDSEESALLKGGHIDAPSNQPNTLENIVRASAFIAVENSQCVGLSCVRTADDNTMGCITNVSVDPAYRGQGIGRGLIDASINYLSNKGVSSIVLMVRHDNRPAIKLYEDFGFEMVETNSLPAGMNGMMLEIKDEAHG